MKLKLVMLALISAYMLSQPVFADDLSELRAQLKVMQEQMQAMQKKLDAQDVTLKKQQKATKEIKHQQAAREKDIDAKAVSHQIADNLSIGGVIEVIANQSNSDGWSGDTASDITLDTFELGIETTAGDWVSGSILFLYEDADDDNLNVDEAFITIANSEATPFYLSAGRLYVPFGGYETNMISDPVTLTLGETREEVAQAGFELDNGFYGSAYVFNGDAEKAKGDYRETDDNVIDNYGLNIGYAIENDDFSLDVGMGYINNIATSDTLQDQVDGNGLCSGDDCVKDYVGGMSFYAVADIGDFNLIGEYVSAMDDFEAGEISRVNGDKLKPAAWNIEGAYNFTLVGKEAKVALGYQKTKDMYLDNETTDFFEKAWLASMTVAIFENTFVSAEWKHAEGYSEVKNDRRAAGDKYDDEDMVQVKLSYEF